VVKLQLIICETLDTGDQRHFLLFTDFSSDYCGKQANRPNIAKN